MFYTDVLERRKYRNQVSCFMTLKVSKILDGSPLQRRREVEVNWQLVGTRRTMGKWEGWALFLFLFPAFPALFRYPLSPAFELAAYTVKEARKRPLRRRKIRRRLRLTPNSKYCFAELLPNELRKTQGKKWLKRRRRNILPMGNNRIKLLYENYANICGVYVNKSTFSKTRSL